MCERTYWIASEQIASGRWAKTHLVEQRLSEEILVCYFNPETRAQMDGAFRFYEVGGKPTPKLELFEDSWLALEELGVPFIAALGSLDERRLGRIATPADVVDALKSLGFRPASPSD